MWVNGIGEEMILKCMIMKCGVKCQTEMNWLGLEWGPFLVCPEHSTDILNYN
jgi:hypothetical protein